MTRRQPVRDTAVLVWLLGALAAIGTGCGDAASTGGNPDASPSDASPGDASEPESSADDAAATPEDSSSSPSDADSLPEQHTDANSSGGGTDGGVDLGDLHASCVSGKCPSGLTPVMYSGIAGPGGPQFCSCEIPCAGNAGACPPPTTCAFIADGPGDVCS